MDVIVPAIPGTYDGFRATLRAFIAEHKPTLAWKQRTGLRVPDRAADVELLRTYVRAIHDAGYVLDRFSAEPGDPHEQRILEQELVAAGVPHVLGNPLVAGALKHFGTDEQRSTYLPPMARGDHIWTQLFSEPDAGSDLASLSTRATPVDGGYLVTGRKVWTSYAQFASWGLCLARTDPEAARPQQGITALIVDMSDPGVDVRPLVQMTGDAEFNEVFLTDVFVPAEHVVGTEGQGWTVAGSTLAHERGTNFPFKEQVVHETYLARLYDEARDNGGLDDPLVADALARSYVDLGVLRLHNLRTLTRLGRGEEPGPESSWIKLTWTTMTQGLSDAGLLVTGRDPSSAEAGPWARQWLWSKAAGIAGGTSQVQRDIIAGRILGLPR